MSSQPPLPEKPSLFTRQVLITLALVVLVLLAWKLMPVLMLFFAGIVFAAALRAGALPLVKRLGLREEWAVGLVAFTTLALLIVGTYAFGHRIAAQAQDLYSAMQSAWEKVQAYVSQSPFGESAVESVKSATGSEAMGKVAKGTFTVFGAIADVLLVVFLAVYLAADPRTYRNGFLRLLPPAARDNAAGAIDASGIALRKWLVGQLGAMVMVGACTAIGLWIAGVPMALALGILSGILDFVPVVGPFIAAVPGVLIAFSQGPEVALYAVIVYVTVQFIEGHFVLPLAQKWAVSLPPALSLLGIVGFGLLFGFIGVLFAIPLLVVGVTMVDKLYVERMSPELPPVEDSPNLPLDRRKKRT